METYKKIYQIAASDMDITYHITPNAILLYFQDCFARFLTTRRLAAFDIVDQNLIWIISEIEMNFIGKRPLWSDQIQVEIEFTEITPIRIYVSYRILNSDGEAFVEGSSCWVIINSISKRPFSPCEMLSQAGITATNEPRKKFVNDINQKDKELRQEVQHQVNVTDLDFNGHVCNRSYLSIAMGTAPLDFIRSHSPRYMHIKFVREAFFEELLKCNVYTNPNKENIFWHQVLNSQQKEICSIYSEWENDESLSSENISDMVKRDK